LRIAKFLIAHRQVIDEAATPRTGSACTSTVDAHDFSRPLKIDRATLVDYSVAGHEQSRFAVRVP